MTCGSNVTMTGDPLHPTQRHTYTTLKMSNVQRTWEFIVSQSDPLKRDFLAHVNVCRVLRYKMVKEVHSFMFQLQD